MRAETSVKTVSAASWVARRHFVVRRASLVFVGGFSTGAGGSGGGLVEADVEADVDVDVEDGGVLVVEEESRSALATDVKMSICRRRVRARSSSSLIFWRAERCSGVLGMLEEAVVIEWKSVWFRREGVFAAAAGVRGFDLAGAVAVLVSPGVAAEDSVVLPLLRV